MQVRDAARKLSTVTVLACAAAMVAGCGGGTADSDVGAKASRQGDLPSVEEVPAIADKVPARIQDKGTLRVVMSTSSPPAHFTASGGMKGADADLAKVLGTVLGLEVKVEGVPLDQILPGLKAERYDAVISQFAPTADRAKVLDFVNYAASGTSLGVRKGNPEGLDVSELCGHEIGVQKGSSQSAEIVPAMVRQCKSAGDKPVKTSTFPESSSAMLALKSSRVDGVLLDSPVLGYAAEQSDGAVEVVETVESQPVAIGTSKGNGLAKPIQAALKHLSKKKVLAKVFEQWGMDDSVIEDFDVNKIDKG